MLRSARIERSAAARVGLHSFGTHRGLTFDGARSEAEEVAQFTASHVEKLLTDTSIIRNRLKILAAINNAARFLEVQREFGKFSKYMWGFVGGEIVDGKRHSAHDIPAITVEAEKCAQDLKKRGFKFLGPTVIYAHMQAVGMVNDHIMSCFRYTEVAGKK